MDDGSIMPVFAEGVCPEHVVVVDETQWESVPLEVISPMHRALITENGNVEPAPDKEIYLKDDAHYGSEWMLARPRDKPRPLVETFIRAGGYDTDVAFLVLLAEYVGADMTEKTLAALLLCIAKKVIKPAELTTALLELIRENIYTAKKILF